MFRRLQDVDKAFLSLAGQYQIRKSTAEAQVQRWSYASAPRYNGIAFYEAFVTWSDACVEVAHFDYAPGKKPIYLAMFDYRDGVPVAKCAAATHGLSVERYAWVEGKLHGVEVHHAPRKKDGSFEQPTLHHSDALFYRSDGKLQRIEVLWPAVAHRAPIRSVVFERRSYGIYRKA